MKNSFALIIALAIPACLEAQQPAGAPPANPVTTVFRNRITTLQRNLAQAFDSIPAAKFSYKPTAPQMSIGLIAQHLANDNYLFCNTFSDKKATRSEKESTTPDSVKATWPKDTLVAQLKASFAFCQEVMAALDDAKLADQVTMTAGAPRGRGPEWCSAMRSIWPIITARSRTTCASTTCSRPLRCRAPAAAASNGKRCNAGC